MKWRAISKHPSIWNLRNLDNQINKVLHLILSEVRMQNAKDLFNVYLVSRQFYMLAIPHLYRNISLDFHRTSHLRLLRRIERAGAAALRHIRILYVTGIIENHFEQFDRLGRLIYGLANLETFKWVGSIQMPNFLLDSLRARFPKLQLGVESTQPIFEVKEEVQPLERVLVHPASSMITHLDVILGEGIDLYEGLKYDLVSMLMCSSVLTYLEIVVNRSGIDHDSTRLRNIKGRNLPRLRDLRLFVRDSSVFTNHELSLLGDNGGWEELIYLGLHHVDSLLQFLGRIPKLDKLWLVPREVEDIDAVEPHLEENKIENPFGALREIEVRLPVAAPGMPITHHVVPWGILRALQPEQLKVLNISHPSQPWEDFE